MGKRTVLVTGSSGRLGSSVAEMLSREHHVVMMDVMSPASPEQRKWGRVVVGSVTDRGAVAQAFEGVDAVVHCAAIPWSRPPFDTLLHTNICGTVNVLEEAGSRAEVEHFIFLSTIRVHGVLEEVSDDFMPRFLPFDETHPFQAQEYYGGGKAHAEHWCRMYVRRFKKPVVALRPSYIVRLHDELHFKAQPAPEKPTLLDYVGTSDVLLALSLALDFHPKDGYDAFLINAADQRSSTPTLDLAARYFPNVPIDREKLAGCDGFAAFLDCCHAQHVLGWKPAYRCVR